MEDVRILISEAKKRVNVESHVLRYWEEELEIPIARNELGHRYYKESDIELFKAIKHLKEQGFQLKAVKMMLPNLGKLDSLNSHNMIIRNDELNAKENEMYSEENEIEHELENETQVENGTSLITGKEGHEIKVVSDDKMEQFKEIMHHIIMDTLRENNKLLSDDISGNVTNGVVKEMSYLMRLQEEKEEDRFKKFDATLREYQRSRSQVAVAIDSKNKKKSKFFKKNKVYL